MNDRPALKSSPYSLAAQLTARWQFKLFWLLMRLNLFVCLLGAVGMIWLWEARLGESYALYQQGVQPVAAVQVEEETAPKGIRLPSAFRRLLPDNTRNGWRGFTWDAVDPEAPPSTIWERVGSVTYHISVGDGDGYIVMSYPAGGWVKTFIWAMIILWGYEIIILWRNGRPSRKMASRLLHPLTEMAQAAENLREQAGVVSGAVAGSRLSQNADRSRDDVRQQREENANLKKLAGTIQQIDADKLGTRLRVDSPQEELRELALAINAMLERINEAYRSQARFVSDASHELRTPISVIQGYANLLDRWGKEDEKTLAEAIDAIKSESERMKTLIDDLLFLARSDNDTQQLALDTVDIPDLLNEVHKETLMIDAGHRWALREDSPPFTLTADPVLLKQAVRILVDNAIKYTPQGEEILLSFGRKEGVACISVQDNGIGIPPDELAHIFDRFYRADASRSRKTGGTGLGLAIAKWIAEKHGGYFEVLSRVDVGTRMTICLPLTQPEEEAITVEEAV